MNDGCVQIWDLGRVDKNHRYRYLSKQNIWPSLRFCLFSCTDFVFLQRYFLGKSELVAVSPFISLLIS